MGAYSSAQGAWLCYAPRFRAVREGEGGRSGREGEVRVVESGTVEGRR